MKSIFKKLILGIVPFIYMSASAATITCYSGENVIYQGKAKDVFNDSGFVFFKEVGTRDYKFISGNCVVTFVHNLRHARHTRHKHK